MWGNLFGAAANPPSSEKAFPAPLEKGIESAKRPGAQAFALGEDPWPQFETAGTSKKASTSPATKPFKNVDSKIEPAKLAERVRSAGAAKMDTAWKRIEEEFDVQNLIWESLKQMKGEKLILKLAPLLDLLRKGLDPELRRTNQANAVSLLEQAVTLGGKDDGEMSKSMAEAIRLLKHEFTTPAIGLREQLAQRLEGIGTGKVNLPKMQFDRADLDNCVAKSELHDPSLERSIRKFLGLPLPSELGPCSEPTSPKRSAPVPKKDSKMGSGVSVSKTSSKVSSGSRMVNGSRKQNSRTHSLGAPASGVKMSSLLLSLPEPSGDLGSATRNISISSNLPLHTRSENAALIVRTLASEKIEASWKDLYDEFGVQKMVWDSLSLQKKVDMKKALQVQATLESAMGSRAKNPTLAVKTIDDLLKKFMDGTESNLLSNSIKKSMCDVTHQASLLPHRSQLAERLGTASIPATLPTQTSEKKELEVLLVTCKLEDVKMENAIRQMLLLPLPDREKCLSPIGENTDAKNKLAAMDSPAVSVWSSGVGSGKPASVGINSAKHASTGTGSGKPAQKKTPSKHRSSSTPAGKAEPPVQKSTVDRISERQVHPQFDPPDRRLMLL